jgi:hypothetical protein
MRRLPLILAVLLIACRSAEPPAFLSVNVELPDETTGTWHYAEKLTIAIGGAKPLVLEGASTPLPGSQFRLGGDRFLLLGWSSTGAGMQSLHALVVGVRNGAVVVDQQLELLTDRVSAGLLVRSEKNRVRIGVPEPPRDFVHHPDDWLLRVRDEELDLDAVRALRYESVEARETDQLYAPPRGGKAMPGRVAWIEVTKEEFVLVKAAR